MRATPETNEKGNLAHHDWTQGNLLKNLLMISWPMVITSTLMSLGPTIDLIWVGKLGDAAVAAVGVAGVVVQLAMCLMMGLTLGMLALISRTIGEKDVPTAQKIAQQAFIVTGAYAVFMALVGHFLGEKILRLITNDPDIVRLGTSYLRIEFIGGATMVFRMMMDAVMQASGDSLNPMWIAVIYRIFHIALCPFLIFGWWFFPELGVSGAAYTGVIAQGLGIVLGFRILLSGRTRLKLSFKHFSLDFRIIWRIIRVGLPTSISDIQRNLSQFIIQIFMAPFGTAALAAHSIVQRIEMLLFVPTMSLGMGAGVLVGQNLGAKQPERAVKSAWLAVGLVEAWVIVSSIVMLIWTEPVIKLFNSDPVLITTGVQYIRIAIVGWALLGFFFVLMNAMQSAGDTISTMIISLVAIWGITMPLAYFLPKYTSWGVYSIRWAMSASMFVGALGNFIYFRTGRWKTRKV
jgi:putative MATE family efflux protein